MANTYGLPEKVDGIPTVKSDGSLTDYGKSLIGHREADTIRSTYKAPDKIEYEGGMYKNYEDYVGNSNGMTMNREQFDQVKMQKLQEQADALRASRREDARSNGGSNFNSLVDVAKNTLAGSTGATGAGSNTADSLYKNTYDSAASKINASANSQIDVIKQNLQKTLAALENEKSYVKPNYDKAMNQISDNQFATTEAQKEMMNMSGWNTSNSGLAVGEVGKIAVGADKSRADVNANLVQALNDIARRVTEANTYSDQEQASIERQRQTALVGADADAKIYADQTAYQRMRDLLSDQRYDKEFSYKQQQDAANLAYQQSRDAVSDSRYQNEFDYQKGRDTVSDQRYQNEFDYQKGRDQVSDKQYQEQFNYQKQRDLINDKNEKIKFDYAKDRDKIQDAQWLKQFNEGVRQSLVQEAISKGHLSVSQGQLALSKARQSYEITKDQQATAKEQAAQKTAAQKQEIVNLALKTMMSSSDPVGWVKSKLANGSLLNDEATEIINTYNKLMQKQDVGVTLAP